MLLGPHGLNIDIVIITMWISNHKLKNSDIWDY